MALPTSIQGQIVDRPLLSALALDQMTPEETPILAAVFPDQQVPAFDFRAPKYNDDNLVVVADDTVGRDTKYLQTDISIGFYNEELGMHGREANIPHLDMMRAMHEAAAAKAPGDPIFDLEKMHTELMIQQNIRHNELLGALLITDPLNYPVSHRFPELDVVNDPNVLEALQDASDLIADEGNGLPANVYVFGVGARRGLVRNPTFLAKLPETSIKRLSREDLTTILELPDGGTLVFPTLRVKNKQGTGLPYPMVDNFIGVYRVVPSPDKRNATWGRNFWTPDLPSGLRVYMNSATDVYRTRKITLVNYYRPIITGSQFGVHIPTGGDIS